MRTSELVDRIADLPRIRKQLIAIAFDATVIPLCLWAAFALRLSALWPPQVTAFWWLFVLAPATAIPLFVASGLYREVVRYIGDKTWYVVTQAVSLHVLALGTIMLLVGFRGFPRSVLIIHGLLSLLAIAGLRFLGRSVLHRHLRGKESPRRVLIFGAGVHGAELAHALQEGSAYLPVAFVDDKRALQGTFVHALRVYGTADLEQLVERFAIDEIFLAIPSASRARRRAVLARLEPLPVLIKTIPALQALVSGRAGLRDVRTLDLDDLLDLLGREPVAPNVQLLDRSVAGRSVMVTGAGGSIGSELCRQIYRLQPARLVLFEVSEPSLYRIHRELELIGIAEPREAAGVEVIPILGSVCDQRRVSSVIRAFGVQTIYHAAAYKHVPLVEYNPIAGVHNNVFGTWHVANAAVSEGVDTLILISTDKAVRPTNVMGAAKRIAELIVQGLATQNVGLRLGIVRFGNVLGSSGSVIPLFHEQIAQGGPLTVTDPEVVRYFMTIPEAAELVIQASAMASGGEVYVLNMGDAVKIIDVARRMVRWKGMRLQDTEHPDGEIAIEFTGLRAGEKLYEELLLGEEVLPTAHPRIMRAAETCLPWGRLLVILARLERACEAFDSGEIRVLLREAVSGYQPQGDVLDPVWRNTRPGVAPTAAPVWN